LIADVEKKVAARGWLSEITPIKTLQPTQTSHDELLLVWKINSVKVPGFASLQFPYTSSGKTRPVISVPINPRILAEIQDG
jgi:hypothetical protein